MNAIYDFAGPLLGLGVDPKDLSFTQISLRGVIVFLVTLVMIRVSSRRSLAEKTAFDAILLIILGAILSRAINGSASFFATIGASFVLVFLHRGFAWVACRSHAFGKLIKGSALVIVEDGKIDERMMCRNHLSRHDLEEDMRLDAQIDDISKVRIARLERSGDISFIKSDA